MTVKVTARRPRQPKVDKPWVEVTTAIEGSKLTEPESYFALAVKNRYPALYARMTRSNLPYEGSNYLSDFTIIEHEHPWYRGLVIEIQGGIYSRHKSGHSSPKGLLRDYAKVTRAQLNRWFVLQVAPDLDSLDQAIENIVDITQQWDEDVIQCDVGLL